MRTTLLLSAALATAGCTLNLQLQPQLPPPNPGPRVPMKVALIVPSATRELTQTTLLPTGCFGLTINPAPQGEIFAQTVQGVLAQAFDQVVAISGLPAPADADLIVQATLSSIGVKPACLASPAFYGEAVGSLSTLDSDGRETWRSARTSARAEEGLPMGPSEYQTIMPKAMTNLASAWASELAIYVAARRPARVHSAENPAASAPGSAPWWQK